MTDWDVAFAQSDDTDARVLTVTGEVDLSAAGRFAQELDTLVGAGADTARVNLSGVTFLDSSGVRELLAANRLAEAAGVRLLLADPSHACVRVLEISGVWDEFTVQRTQP